MTDVTLKSDDKPQAKGSILQSMIAAFIASYFVNKLSLAGVNFETLGVSSELVKAAIVGQLTVFFGWATATNIVNSLRASILFVRNSYLSLRQAAEQGKE